MNNVKAYKHPESGLKILLTTIPDSESCAISLMLRVGSIYEPKGLYGGAHVIEHMVFKGTKTLPNKSQLSRRLDSMGAIYNAYTEYTMTSYHIKVQSKFLSEVIKILCEMVSQSLFKKTDLKPEKEVVIEELRRERDDPAAYIQEIYYETIFKNCLLGRSIGGSIDDVKQIDYQKLVDFWKKHYKLDNIVISVAANTNINTIIQAIDQSNLLSNVSDIQQANETIINQDLQTSPRCKVQTRKNMNQVQVIIGYQTFGNQHPDRFPLDVLRCILGGNMSSRLFIKLRDDYGLAYSVSANIGLYDDIGEFSISCGVDPSNIF